MQKIIVIGRLGKEVELRYTPAGDAVADFTVASTYKNETTWFRVTAWRAQAENCAKYLSKGRQVYVEGTLSVETWTDTKNDRERFTLCVDARDVQFLGAKDETTLADEKESPKEGVAAKGKDKSSAKKAQTADIPF